MSPIRCGTCDTTHATLDDARACCADQGDEEDGGAAVLLPDGGGPKYVRETGPGYQTTLRVNGRSITLGLSTMAVDWTPGTDLGCWVEADQCYLAPLGTAQPTPSAGAPVTTPTVRTTNRGRDIVEVTARPLGRLDVPNGGDVRVYTAQDRPGLVCVDADADPRLATDGGRRRHPDALGDPRGGVGDQDPTCEHGTRGCPGTGAGPAPCALCFLDGGDES